MSGRAKSAINERREYHPRPQFEDFFRLLVPLQYHADDTGFCALSQA